MKTNINFLLSLLVCTNCAANRGKEDKNSDIYQKVQTCERDVKNLAYAMAVKNQTNDKVYLTKIRHLSEAIQNLQKERDKEKEERDKEKQALNQQISDIQQLINSQSTHSQDDLKKVCENLMSLQEKFDNDYAKKSDLNAAIDQLNIDQRFNDLTTELDNTKNTLGDKVDQQAINDAVESLRNGAIKTLQNKFDDIQNGEIKELQDALVNQKTDLENKIGEVKSDFNADINNAMAIASKDFITAEKVNELINNLQIALSTKLDNAISDLNSGKCAKISPINQDIPKPNNALDEKVGREDIKDFITTDVLNQQIESIKNVLKGDLDQINAFLQDIKQFKDEITQSVHDEGQTNINAFQRFVQEFTTLKDRCDRAERLLNNYSAILNDFKEDLVNQVNRILKSHYVQGQLCKQTIGSPRQ